MKNASHVVCLSRRKDGEGQDGERSGFGAIRRLVAVMLGVRDLLDIQVEMSRWQWILSFRMEGRQARE